MKFRYKGVMKMLIADGGGLMTGLVPTPGVTHILPEYAAPTQVATYSNLLTPAPVVAGVIDKITGSFPIILVWGIVIIFGLFVAKLIIDKLTK